MERPEVVPAVSPPGTGSAARPVDWTAPLETDEDHPRRVVSLGVVDGRHHAMLAEDAPWAELWAERVGYAFNADGTPYHAHPDWCVRNGSPRHAR